MPVVAYNRVPIALLHTDIYTGIHSADCFLMYISVWLAPMQSCLQITISRLMHVLFTDFVVHALTQLLLGCQEERPACKN